MACAVIPETPIPEMPTLEALTEVAFCETAVMFTACVLAIVAPSATYAAVVPPVFDSASWPS